MLTILPYPRGHIVLSASCEQKNAERRFTVMTRSHSSGVISGILVSRPIPAALTRMSIRPCRETTRERMRRISGTRATSSFTNSAAWPSRRSSSAAWSPSFSLTSAMTTVPPSRPICWDAALPIPLAPPVTRAILPVSSILGSFPLVARLPGLSTHLCRRRELRRGPLSVHAREAGVGEVPLLAH